MKICLVSNIFPPHTRGGYELGCRDIARALVAAGHDVRIVTSMTVGTLRKSAEIRDLQIDEIFDPVFGYEADLVAPLRQSAPWVHEWTESFCGVHYGNALAFGGWLQQHRPDVVWLFNPIGLGPVGLFEAALSTPARVLTLLMDDIDCYILNGCRNLTWVPRFRRLKSRITAISCSRGTRALNQKIGDYRTHRVIYNGMKFPADPPTPAGGSEVFSFCYFGAIDEPKGLLELVRAARALHAARPELRFDVHIYGSGNRAFRDRLAAEIRDTGMGQQVTLHGFVEKEELMRRVRQYDVALMLLKDTEPYAYAPIEAAICGLPLILTAKGGNGESVRAGYPLLVHDRNDAAAVANLMAWCVDHRDRLPELARQIYTDFRATCEFDSVTLPSYLETIAQTPPNTEVTSIESLVASCRTADLYAQSRLPIEQLRTIAKGGSPVVRAPV